MPIYMGIFEKPHVLDRKFRGEVKAKGYEGWIPLQSAKLGTNRHTQEIVSSKLQDSVSTALYKEALYGEGKLIVIAFVKEDGTTSMTLVLQNTLISSYNVSGHGGGDLRPTESLSINFTKMTFEMSPTSPDTTH